MRTILTLLCLSGCLPTNQDDTRGGLHTVTVRWSIKNADGSMAACPPGFVDILVSVTNKERSAQEQQQVPCASTGTHDVKVYTSGNLYYSMPDDPARYVWRYTENQEVILYITDPTGQNVRTESIMVPVKLDADKSVDVELYPDAGFAVVRWQLKSGITNSFVFNCIAVALDRIEYRYREFSDEQGPLITDAWACDNHDMDFPYLGTYDVGSGRTRALPPGNYEGVLYGMRGGAVIAMDEGVHTEILRGADVRESANGEIVVPDR